MTQGLDIEVIHEAIAARLRVSIERSIKVFAYPEPSANGPKIEVWPNAGGWVDYDTVQGREADIFGRLRVEVVATDAGSRFKAVAAFSSAGIGQPSSIYDAIEADRTLGGVVERINLEPNEWDAGEESDVVWFPFIIWAVR